MNYKQNLEKFIESIENNNITQNEVIVGHFDDIVISFLEKKGIIVENREILLSVKGYKHAQRDFKHKLNKAIPKEIMNEIYLSLHKPTKIIFDNQKNKLNLLYIDKNEGILFKIVVKPNYILSKKRKVNYVLTAGIIKEIDIIADFYENVK